MTIRQFGLFDRERSIEERFLSFHARHPEVYDELVRLARQVIAAGRRRIGIRLLWERMRWTFYIERGRDDFKMNDHFHSRYARMLMEREPDLAGLFETRELRAV